MVCPLFFVSARIPTRNSESERTTYGTHCVVPSAVTPLEYEDLNVLEAYRKHVEERAAEGVPPKPLDAEQTAALVELLKNPPAGEEEFILDLLTNRVPAGVDQAAYVKACFLAAIAKG